MTREWRWTPGQTVLPGSSVPAAPSATAPATASAAVANAAAGAAAAGAAAYGVAASVPAAPAAPVPVTPLRHVAPLEPPAADDGSGTAPEAAVGVPAPRAPLPAAVPGSSLARWISYFDAVEQAALAVAEKIAEGHSPTWPDLVVPAATLPASMVARRDEVIALVDDVTARAERRRDVIASELSALAPPAARPALPAGLGATLDVVG